MQHTHLHIREQNMETGSWAPPSTHVHSSWPVTTHTVTYEEAKTNKYIHMYKALLSFSLIHIYIWWWGRFYQSSSFHIIWRLRREFVTNMLWQCLTKFCQNQDVSVSVTYLSPTDASTPNTFPSPPHVAFSLSPPQAKTKTLNCLLAQINLKIWRIGKNQFYLTLWGLFPFPTSSRGKNSEVLKIRRIGKNQCYLNCEAYMDSSPRPLVVVRGVLWGDGSIMSPPLLALLLLRYIQPFATIFTFPKCNTLTTFE